MIVLPLPCLLLTNYASNVIVDTLTFGTLPKDIESINPHSIGETVDFVWVRLSITNVQYLETIFRGARGSKRFSYNFGAYLMNDTYTISVANNKMSLQASFVRVL